MSWFLVLLFWNPMFQDFETSAGWAPIPYATQGACEDKLGYIEQYLPNYSADIEYTVGCVLANSQQEAITILRGPPQGDNV